MTYEELKDAVRWYKQRHGSTPVERSVFTTFICGYFHTYPRNASFILKEMQECDLITITKGKVIPSTKR